ncbi:hypothetical protein [Neosynechococcus sphagnicola]|nr:hypothetical protein [Neosynechococcus sphagnicola]
MGIEDLPNTINSGESSDWEFKSARGGVPGKPTVQWQIRMVA